MHSKVTAILLSVAAAGAVAGGVMLASKLFSPWKQPPIRLGAYAAFKGGYFPGVVKAEPASAPAPARAAAATVMEAPLVSAGASSTSNQLCTDTPSIPAATSRGGAPPNLGAPSSPAVPGHALVADASSSFCVLLIGFRYPSLWTAIRHFRTLSLLRGGLRAAEDEALADPSSGLEHVERYGTPLRGLSIQYWRSHEHLDKWARTSKGHQSRRVAFHKHMEHSGMYGMWHETYVVRPGQYEAVYVDMPPTGLGHVGHAQPVERGLRTGKERMAASKQVMPAEV